MVQPCDSHHIKNGALYIILLITLIKTSSHIKGRYPQNQGTSQYMYLSGIE